MSQRVALVFGGTRGIGAAAVQALAETGFDVGYTGTQPAPATPQSRAGRTIRVYQADVQKPDQVAAVFAQAAGDFGRTIDCVIVNAGIITPATPVAQFDPEQFRRLMEVNLFGAFNVLAEAARRVADGGNIIALTSSLVRHAAPGFGPYSASKAAVESLVRAMARELSPRKVRVNAVAPGPVDTDLFRAGKTEEAKQRSAALSPLNRVGEPSEVAQVIAFLASDRASWVHGQVVQPNGGLV